MDVQLHSFVTSVYDGEWSNSLPCRSAPPPGRNPVPNEEEGGCSPQPVPAFGRREISLAPDGLARRVVTMPIQNSVLYVVTSLTV